MRDRIGAGTWLRTTLAVAALTLAGCGGEGDTAESPPPADVDLPPPRTLPLPSTNPQAEAPDAAARSRVLAWETPAGWSVETPSSRMRLAQYSVEGPGGRAECIVYYFGPGQGGEAMANAERWAGQFEQPDGSDSRERLQVSRIEGTTVPVQLVELTGTYDGGMTMTDAPAESLPGYMLLGGIAEGPDAPWFFKFTGPEATVRQQKDAFIAMMRSLRPQ